MERHARVEKGKIIIGTQSYDKVIASYCRELLPSTLTLLEKYKKQGGVLYNISDLPDNNIVEDEDITYTSRQFDDHIIHFFVNSMSERKVVKINAGGQILDFYTGEKKDFCGIHEFEPWGSLMLIDDATKSESFKQQKASTAYLSDTFRVSENTMNTLTLDKCDYYFDGVLQERNGYVLNICERANTLEKGVQIHQVYHVRIDVVPEKLYLICETPEKFDIYINGKILEHKEEGYFLDKSFKKYDIHALVHEGDNTISFDCDFVQSEEFYGKLRNAQVFESEKNKLAYDMEIEPVYLVGDFGVRTTGTWQSLDGNAYRYAGDFVIDKLPERISLKNIEQQGFPFFCGELELEGEVDIRGDNSVLDVDIKGINVVRFEIENKHKTLITGTKITFSDCTKGRHRTRITLINNLRNMMGPHHLEEGECCFVGPFSFYKEKCVWNENPESAWNDQYCFAEISMIAKLKGEYR